MPLDAAGPVADSIATLTRALFIGGTLVFGAVMLLLWLAVARSARPIAPRVWLLGGGVVLPGAAARAVAHRQRASRPRVDGAGAGRRAADRRDRRMWWWELRYPDPAGGVDIVTANELHLPVGRTGATVAVEPRRDPQPVGAARSPARWTWCPGASTHLVLRQRRGVFDGACAEYCGEQHTRMALRVIASEPAQFDAWLQQQRAPAREPAAPLERAGRDAFLASGCAACHRIAGVSLGRLGPETSATWPAAARWPRCGCRTTSRRCACGSARRSRSSRARTCRRSRTSTPPRSTALAAYLATLR